MTAEKSNNNDKPASAMEKFKPANEMSGDEMYAVALKLPNEHPYKAYLECELRKLYERAAERASPAWKAVIPNRSVPGGTQENPSYGSWDGTPDRYAPGEAWAFMSGEWTRVNSTDVGMNSRLLSKAQFTSQFGELPPLPAAAFNPSFAEEKWPVPADECVRFSAWDYADERSQAITSHGKVRETDDAGSATKTNPDVYKQSKATRAKAALDALRSGELPLGTLTSEEQSWLATAFTHLNRIYESREAGRPGNNAVCVFDVGNVYVQFLAPWDAELLVCEAVSAKSVPEIAAILTTEGDAVLRRLGFEEPEISPNYSQSIKIKGAEDLAYAARLAFRVLKQVYRVADFGSATFDVKIPSNS